MWAMDPYTEGYCLVFSLDERWDHHWQYTWEGSSLSHSILNHSESLEIILNVL